MYIASFDMGTRNFSFCVELVDEDSLKEIKNIPEKARYELDGTPTPSMSSILDQVCLNGEVVLFRNVDLTMMEPKCSTKSLGVLYNLTNLLDSLTEYWEKCSLILIEQQMNFGKTKNPVALRLQHHCYSYFAIKYGRTKTIVDFPAYYKTLVLGAPKNEGKLCKNGKTRYVSMTKPERKKWAVEKAREILESREETNTLELLEDAKKKDDLSDCICQCNAGKYLVFVDNKNLSI